MATRTISNAGGNWNAAGTWAEGVVPTASDAVVATGTSGNVTVNTSTCVCLSLTLTGFTGTLDFAAGNTLSVSGSITLAGTITGTGTLKSATGGTLTANGITFPGDLVFTGITSRTIADTWTVTGLVSVPSSAPALIGGALNCLGGFSFAYSASSGLAGSCVVKVKGGTLSTSAASYIAFTTWGIDGNVTLGTYINIGTGTFTRYSGTVTVTGSTFGIRGSVTLGLGTSMRLADVSVASAGVSVSLTDNLYIDGTLAVAASATAAFAGAYSVYVFGVSGSASTVSGGATLVFSGTGSISGTTTLGINTTINSTGTVTFAAGGVTTMGQLKTFSYVAGTVVSAGHIVRIWGTGSYDFGGLVWNYVKVDIATSSTLTLLSDLRADTVDIVGPGAAVFAGAFRVACATYRQIAGSTVRLPSGACLCVSENLIVNGSDVLTTTIEAVSGTPALNYSGALGGLRVYSLTITGIDASTSAIPIYVLWGTATSCTNATVMTSAQLAVDVFGSFG